MNFDTLQSVMDWMQAHPALAGIMVFIIASTESLVIVGIVVPGVALMLGVGALVGLGVLDLWSTLLWAVLGAVAGDGISYWVGRHFDRQLRSVWPFTRHPELLPRGERFFHKHGALSIFIGRFVGPVRPVIPAIAGVMHMNPLVFYVVNIGSAIAWAPVVILPGVAVGASMHLASELAGRFMLIFLCLLLLLWGCFVLLRTLDKKFVAPRLSRSARFGKVDYKHMPGLLFKYLLESTFGVFLLTLALGIGLANYGKDSTLVQLPQTQRLQWWQGQWNQYLGYRDLQEQIDPFTLQWWGSDQQIRKTLQDNQWVEAQVLTYRNVLLWLSPSLEVQQLPLPNHLFSSRSQQVFYVHKDADGQTQWVLRMWSVQDLGSAEQESLWLGTVTKMTLKDLFGFRIPRLLNAGASELIPKLQRHDESLQFKVLKVSFSGQTFDLLLIE